MRRRIGLCPARASLPQNRFLAAKNCASFFGKASFLPNNGKQKQFPKNALGLQKFRGLRHFQNRQASVFLQCGKNETPVDRLSRLWMRAFQKPLWETALVHPRGESFVAILRHFSVSAMPLETPNLLRRSGGANMPVKKSDVDSPPVPRNGKVRRLLAVTKPLTVVIGGLIFGGNIVIRASASPHRVQKQGNFRRRMSANFVERTPVIFFDAALNGCRGVINPVVVAIACCAPLPKFIGRQSIHLGMIWRHIVGSVRSSPCLNATRSLCRFNGQFLLRSPSAFGAPMLGVGAEQQPVFLRVVMRQRSHPFAAIPAASGLNVVSFAKFTVVFVGVKAPD